MQLSMAGLTENKGFSVFGCHKLLPEFLPFCDIFEFPYMVDFKRPLPRLTIFALTTVEPFDHFRAAERPDVDIRLLVNCWIIWQRSSEVFETEHSNDAGLLFSLDDEC